MHPRSGLAARHGISIVNAPGTIDAGYRGEVQVCLVNTDREAPFTVHRESNPTDDPSMAVIARVGGGVPTVNVDKAPPPHG